MISTSSDFVALGRVLRRGGVPPLRGPGASQSSAKKPDHSARDDGATRDETKAKNTAGLPHRAVRDWGRTSWRMARREAAVAGICCGPGAERKAARRETYVILRGVRVSSSLRSDNGRLRQHEQEHTLSNGAAGRTARRGKKHKPPVPGAPNKRRT
jgi:hypothetical protein